MNYDLFKRLVNGRETATVDFKIQCGAFDTGNSSKNQENAELLKDICAMANNGNATSYILVGVANDGRHFQSVTNAQLTSDNVQRLIQEYLRPVPRVRVHSCLWRRSALKHRHKHFIVIQVGPNPRFAFHFARDLIDWQNKTCFRRNEVWVRNDATSDVATPDQILRLMGKNPPDDSADLDHNTAYFKAPRDEQHGLVMRDALAFFQEIAAPVSKAFASGPGSAGRTIWTEDRLVGLRIRGKDFAFRCGVRRGFSERHIHGILVSQCWELEHGILFLPLQDPVRSSFTGAIVHHKQSWGWFTLYGQDIWYPRLRLPRQERRLQIPVLTLRSPKDTAQLRRALTGLIDFLESDDVTFAQLDTARTHANRYLRYRSNEAAVRRVVDGRWPPEDPSDIARQARTVLAFIGKARG